MGTQGYRPSDGFGKNALADCPKNEEDPMTKVQKLVLEQFTAFGERAEFAFSPGINVFIGANSTGKTHALKALYTLLKVCERAKRDFPANPLSDMKRLEVQTQDKFEKVFKPENVGRLVRHRRGRGTGCLELHYAEKSLTVKISTLGRVSIDSSGLPEPEPSVFLPAHEFLSAYHGFIAAYELRETAFDEIYYDLALALNAAPIIKGKKQESIKSLIDPIQEAIQGATVTQENGKFYVALPEAKLEAPLVAEGYRKLAGLIYLLNNGSLTKNGILFWDEPEANLNPRLVTTIVRVLKILADSGVQVFVSTHDYLVSQKLSLLAEYRQAKDLRFFSFRQPASGEAVVIETRDNLSQLSENPILDEFAAHYDAEMNLFKRA